MRIPIYQARCGDVLTTKSGMRFKVDRVRRHDDEPDVLILESRVSPGAYFEVLTDVAHRAGATMKREGGE